MIPGFKIHVKHTFIPAARADWMIGIVTDRINHSLHETDAQRFGILRHEENVAAPLMPELPHEIGKARGVGQIEGAARLASVAVATRNDGTIHGGGKLDDGFVFRPDAHCVELEGVKVFDEFFYEAVKNGPES